MRSQLEGRGLTGILRVLMSFQSVRATLSSSSRKLQGYAGVAELADAGDSKSPDRKVISVRPRAPAPTIKLGEGSIPTSGKSNPTRSLIADADSRHPQPMACRQPPQVVWQLPSGATSPTSPSAEGYPPSHSYGAVSPKFAGFPRTTADGGPPKQCEAEASRGGGSASHEGGKPGATVSLHPIYGWVWYTGTDPECDRPPFDGGGKTGPCAPLFFCSAL
jgi:hypothetical protein